jgi:Fur family ferric uptake transcriptional regulator
VSEEILKQHQLKVTAPRRHILEVFQQAPDSHFSAESIYQQLGEANIDIGLATVYRVLSQFEAIGLIERHIFTKDHFVYELKKEGHHDHLVCQACHLVLEFFDNMIEQRQDIIAETHDFLIQDHQHIIYGICPACQKKGDWKATS